MKNLDDEVCRLWKKGKTSSEIAGLLEITRSAVMGRVNRLRARGLLDFRVIPGPRKPRTQHAPKSGGRKMPFVISAYPGKPIRRRKGFDVSAEKKIEPERMFQHVTLMELQHDHCRYIVGENKIRGTLYCGQPQTRRSYCESHALICYHTPTKASERKPRRKLTGISLPR